MASKSAAGVSGPRRMMVDCRTGEAATRATKSSSKVKILAYGWSCGLDESIRPEVWKAVRRVAASGEFL